MARRKWTAEQRKQFAQTMALRRQNKIKRGELHEETHIEPSKPEPIKQLTGNGFGVAMLENVYVVGEMTPGAIFKIENIRAFVRQN